MSDEPFVFDMVNTETGESVSMGSSEEVSLMLACGPWTITDECKARLDTAIAEGRKELGMEPRF